MSKGKDIRPRSDKGEPHGLWVMHGTDGQLWYKCLFHNDRRVGYEKWCDYYNGKLTKKKYNI